MRVLRLILPLALPHLWASKSLMPSILMWTGGNGLDLFKSSIILILSSCTFGLLFSLNQPMLQQQPEELELLWELEQISTLYSNHSFFSCGIFWKSSSLTKKLTTPISFFPFVTLPFHLFFAFKIISSTAVIELNLS